MTAAARARPRATTATASSGAALRGALRGAARVCVCVRACGRVCGRVCVCWGARVSLALALSLWGCKPVVHVTGVTAAAAAACSCFFCLVQTVTHTHTHTHTHAHTHTHTRRPVRVVPDPIRGAPHLLVMCEVLSPDGTPHPTNTRAQLAALIDDKVRRAVLPAVLHAVLHVVSPACCVEGASHLCRAPGRCPPGHLCERVCEQPRQAAPGRLRLARAPTHTPRGVEPHSRPTTLPHPSTPTHTHTRPRPRPRTRPRTCASTRR
jgi:hypothetical protein